MTDQSFRRQLQKIEGEEPSEAFVEQLRRRIQSEPSSGLSFIKGTVRPRADDRLPRPSAPEPQTTESEASDTGAVTMVDLDRHRVTHRRRISPLLPFSAAAVVLVVMLLAVTVRSQGPPLETATTTEAQQVGDAWLLSIVENDRETFVSLHRPDLEANDTLMGYSRDVALLTPSRVSELYLDGFDAFQRSVALDQDEVVAQGCEGTDERRVRCSFTTTLIGTVDYRYIIAAELTVEDRLITTVDFVSVTTEPTDLQSEIEMFMNEEATDEDRACLLLGFNTVGCGEHDSDFLRRYIAFYEASNEVEQPPLDS